MTDMKAMDRRYRQDPMFARLVDMLYGAIMEGKLTPSETREAAMLAQLRYELEHPRPVMISADLLNELRLRGLAGEVRADG